MTTYFNGGISVSDLPEGNGWKGDPFVVREIEGWLLGRGVELAITVRRDFLQDVVDRFRISSFSLEGSL